jgi:hypothetical protein
VDPSDPRYLEKLRPYPRRIPVVEGIFLRPPGGVARRTWPVINLTAQLAQSWSDRFAVLSVGRKGRTPTKAETITASKGLGLYSFNGRGWCWCGMMTEGTTIVYQNRMGGINN